jgi:hypothetical protein
MMKIDPLIEAYNALGIDIVSMILNDHQLPQLDLVRDVYIYQIKKVHPNKNSDYDAYRGIINDSYAKIKNLVKYAKEQFEFIQPVLQFFHKGAFPPGGYVVLFLAGGLFTIWLLR